MQALVKLRNNLFSLKALRVWGLRGWLSYLGNFVWCIPAILRSRGLRPLDQVMGRTAREFRVRGSRVVLDCAYCDEHVRDGSFAFGGAREIYIRDCYFRFHRPELWNSMRTVVDLGANRGTFSVMAAARCKFVLCVEAQSHFAPVIRHNMRVNGFSNYAIETALMGGGGVLANHGAPKMTMDELLDRHGIDHADMVKVDIEGSEFALFERSDWLQRIGALSMEVHPRHGRTLQLLHALKAYGFVVQVADENLRHVSDPDAGVFLYAAKSVPS
jgi:hypothetical protein